MWGPPSGGLTPRVFFRDIFPLGAAVLISALYFRIDVYFIQQWHGFQPVGGYNAAFRLVDALRLLPAAVMAVTFPLLVHATDAHLVRKIGGRLAVAGLALAAVCALGATVIVPLIYGASYTVRRAGVCRAVARLAAVLPELRPDAPGDRLGRPARLPRDCHPRPRRATSPPTSC